MDQPRRVDLEHEHRPAAVAARLGRPRSSALSDWILGAIDGAVTTFAIVAGVTGAALSAGVVVVLGLANLLADGLSMAASRYLGAQAELERRDRARQRELLHVRLVPEGEREEIRQILATKGFAGPQLEEAIEVVSADEEIWVQFMLTEELGFAAEPDRPLIAATATFAGFLLCGALPILPFVVDVAVTDVARPSVWSAALTALAFLTVGALKAQVVGLPRTPAALRTLAIGGLAAALAFAVGWALQDIA